MDLRQHPTSFKSADRECRRARRAGSVDDSYLHRATADGNGAGDNLSGGGGGGGGAGLDVLAGVPAVLRRTVAAGCRRVLRHQTASLQLLELRLRGRLLREHRGLDPVEQTLEPADELRLRDAELRLGRDAFHRWRELGELLATIW